jgi:hypothetical protein
MNVYVNIEICIYKHDSCIYINTYVCLYVYVHGLKSLLPLTTISCKHINIYIRIRVLCIYKHMQVYSFTHVYVCIYVCIFMCPVIYIYVYMYMYIYVFIYISDSYPVVLSYVST